MKKILLFTGSFTPLFLYASINNLIWDFNLLLDTFAQVASGFAFLVFLWGVVSMMFGMGNYGGDPARARELGKKRMVWGLVGLFVIISVWGLVLLLITIFGIPDIPSERPPHIIY